MNNPRALEAKSVAKTEILDPYGEPKDHTAAEKAVVSEIKPGTGRRLLRAALILVIALAIGFFYVHARKDKSERELADATAQLAAEAPTVEVIKVGISSPVQTVTLPGATAAWDETTIYSRVNGYVAKWNVDIGDSVSAGQTLATLETPEVDAELAAAKAKLNATEAEVAVRQSQEDFANVSYARWRDSPKGVVSDEERDSKKAALAEAQANLIAARAQVDLQKAEVDRLTVLTEFKQVKAPFDGTIVKRNINTGDLVTAGSTANTTALYRLAQENPIRVFVHAPQSVADVLISQGGEATIAFDGKADLEFKGKVSRTAKALDPSSRTLRTEIDLPNADHKLVPGLYAHVSLQVTGKQLIQLPPAAMQFRASGPQVAVVDDSDVVHFRKVSIVSDDGKLVGVQSDLKPGDRVIINLSSQISDGATVKTHDLTQADK